MQLACRACKVSTLKFRFISMRVLHEVLTTRSKAVTVPYNLEFTGCLDCPSHLHSSGSPSRMPRWNGAVIQIPQPLGQYLAQGRRGRCVWASLRPTLAVRALLDHYSLPSARSGAKVDTLVRSRIFWIASTRGASRRIMPLTSFTSSLLFINQMESSTLSHSIATNEVSACVGRVLGATVASGGSSRSLGHSTYYTWCRSDFTVQVVSCRARTLSLNIQPDVSIQTVVDSYALLALRTKK